MIIIFVDIARCWWNFDIKRKFKNYFCDCKFFCSFHTFSINKNRSSIFFSTNRKSKWAICVCLWITFFDWSRLYHKIISRRDFDHTIESIINSIIVVVFSKNFFTRRISQRSSIAQFFFFTKNQSFLDRSYVAIHDFRKQFWCRIFDLFQFIQHHIQYFNRSKQIASLIDFEFTLIQTAFSNNDHVIFSFVVFVLRLNRFLFNNISFNKFEIDFDYKNQFCRRRSWTKKMKKWKFEIRKIKKQNYIIHRDKRCRYWIIVNFDIKISILKISCLKKHKSNILLNQSRKNQNNAKKIHHLFEQKFFRLQFSIVWCFHSVSFYSRNWHQNRSWRIRKSIFFN